ncbi:MAG: hypothetical protein BHV81_01960 [Butyricimonas synergistica]|nr:MAG: hypothetical protein BHV81_01960 [Butyricimonas synergistica]
MKNISIFVLVIVVFFLVGCTKENFIKSGVCDGRFNGSLLEYMEAPGHSYDWDSTALMVRHAGDEVIRLFEGQHPDYPEITFFGPTNHSVRRYMLQNGIKRVEDLDPGWCKEILLKHIVKGKIYRDDVTAGKSGGSQTGEEGETVVGEGGDILETIVRTKIWVYSFRESYSGIEDLGANSLYLKSFDQGILLEIVSTDIEPDNCVVHSLSYAYTLGEI